MQCWAVAGILAVVVEGGAMAEILGILAGVMGELLGPQTGKMGRIFRMLSKTGELLIIFNGSSGGILRFFFF